MPFLFAEVALGNISAFLRHVFWTATVITSYWQFLSTCFTLVPHSLTSNTFGGGEYFLCPPPQLSRACFLYSNYIPRHFFSLGFLMLVSSFSYFPPTSSSNTFPILFTFTVGSRSLTLSLFHGLVDNLCFISHSNERLDLTWPFFMKGKTLMGTRELGSTVPVSARTSTG